MQLLRFKIVSFLLLIAGLPSFAQLVATGDTTICQGGLAQLGASGGGASYFWTSDPHDPSLLIPNQQNPVVSPQQNTVYVVQSNIATGNLILNGSFELGNTGFSSEYVYNPNSIFAEGTYAVVSDANTVHSSFFCNQDHTSGSGLFMAINGSGVANVRVWYIDLPNIQPNTDYEFSTWITSLHATNPAVLQFSINGELMGDPFHAYSSTCDWYQFFHIWNSDTNTSAAISIVNQNTILSGNDFALDDISFATVFVYYDTVWVDVLPQLTSSFSAPDAACTGEIVTITFTGNAADTMDFHWDFDGGIVMSGSGPGPYQVYWDTPATYTVSLLVTGEEACDSDTSFHDITVSEAPSVTLTADQTIIAFGESTILHGSMGGTPGPFSFEWSPENMLVDPGSQDPQTVNLVATTSFVFTVTDESTGCQASEEITITVAGGPLNAQAVADPGVICFGESSQLFVTGTGGTGSYTYSWTSVPPGFVSGIQDPVVIPGVTTTYLVTIEDGFSQADASVTVEVTPLPEADAGNDQFIPFGTSTTLHGDAFNGSGNYQYHWEPAIKLLDPDVQNPVTVNLDVNTLFTLLVTDGVTTCISEEDTVFINLEGGPLNVVIFSEDQVICEGNSTLLWASVSGGDTTAYVYTWTDNFGNNFPQEATINVSPDQTTTFTVSVSDGFNTVEDQFTLTVNPVPEFEIGDGKPEITACPFDSVLLTSNPTSPAWEYLWSNGSTEESIKVGTTGIGFEIQTYDLFITNPEGCSSKREVTIIFDFAACFGVDENADNSAIILYPNPSNGILKLEPGNPFELQQLTVYDIFSKLILAQEYSDNGPKQDIITLDLSNQPKGIYLIRLTGKERVKTGTIIIL